jgi:hypothetical protein
MLAQLHVVPIAPGGYVHVDGTKIVIPPKAIVILPALVWNTGRSLWRMPWTAEVHEVDFLKALEPKKSKAAPKAADGDPAAPPQDTAPPLLVNLSMMGELHRMAKANGINSFGKKKAEIIDLLLAVGVPPPADE